MRPRRRRTTGSRTRPRASRRTWRARGPTPTATSSRIAICSTPTRRTCVRVAAMLRRVCEPQFRHDGLQQHDRPGHPLTAGACVRPTGRSASRCSTKCCRVCRSRSATSGAGSRGSPSPTTWPSPPLTSTSSALRRPSDPRLPGGGSYTLSGSLRREAGVVRRDRQLHHLLGQVRKAVSAIPGRGHHRQRAAAQRPDHPGRCRAGADRRPTVARSATKLPEIAALNPWCHIVTGQLPHTRRFGSYVLPKVDVQIERDVHEQAGHPGQPVRDAGRRRRTGRQLHGVQRRGRAVTRPQPVG